MTEQKEALKPCPFCNAPALDGYHEAYSTDSSYDFIGCSEEDRCGVQIPYRNGERHFAITAWNTRSQPPVAVPGELVARAEGFRTWLLSICDTDFNEIVADGGVTAGMVVQQEAREQLRRIDKALTSTPPVDEMK